MANNGAEPSVHVTHSAGETQALGGALASLLQPGDVVLLVGELGAGKTCFTQGLAHALGVDEQVTSPTFTLMREYRGRIPLYHLDAYRLEGVADLYSIGVEEYLDRDGALVVEWGDRARDFFDMDLLEVTFAFGDDEEERHIRFVPRGSSWEQRLAEMQMGSGGSGNG